MTAAIFLGAGAVSADEPKPSDAPADAASVPAPTREQAIYFEQHVRPLLAKHCWSCHGEEKQKGGLRLDSRAAILTGGESGAAIEPGEPDASLLIEAVNYSSFQMPPDGKISDREIASLAEWIKIGAPWPGDQPAATKTTTGKTLTDGDRSWWAFQPPADVQPPQLDADAWSRNDVDRFLLARLRAEGIEPAPEADRATLIRRLYFDLIGLPPTPDEVDQFVADPRPDAYERLVDRLLDSPHYGEKWARHWLDLVRYAESDGFKQDAFRPHAWRYRDYVVRSMNDDKPYDRFLMEQLAGDELMPGDPEGLIAASYLRLWIYEYNQRDVRTQWENILNDITDVTADAMLGLGMRCARCHDHKFDPLLQEDYFRLQAFFTPLLPRDDLFLAPVGEVAEYQSRLAEWESKTEDVRRRIAEIEAPFRERAANAAIDKFPKDVRPMLRKPAAEREPFEHQLAELAGRQIIEELNNLNVAAKLKGEEKDEYERLVKELKEVGGEKPAAPPAAFSVSDVGTVAPPTKIPDRRSAGSIEPGFLTVLDSSAAEIEPLPQVASTGRRTALARWIASPDNPLTSRVIVNRVWQQHFGRGIVGTASDFGHLGEPPSHPELLDWLARRFVADGWRFKSLHRLLVTSAAYRQSSHRAAPEIAARSDSANHWLWRMPVRRIDAESIRDALLATSGELNLSAGGPSVDPNQPRRSIYLKAIRNERDPLLDVFDVVDGFSSVAQRNVTTTPSQSLVMMNGPWAIARAAAFAERAMKEAGDDPGVALRQAYRLAFGRQPSTGEMQAAQEFIQQQMESRQTERNRIAPLVDAMPQREGRAALVRPGTHQDRLRMRGVTQLPEKDFTIEAFVVLHSMYEDASVRTIASRWDGNQSHVGWSLGVTSKKSAYQPLNLILQFVGNTSGGELKYEVVPSNLRLELNKPYYVAASVRLDQTEVGGVKFFLRDLSGDRPLQTAEAAHQVVTFSIAEAGTNTEAGIAYDAPFMIGGRHKITSHTWDGLIDDVRLSNAAIPSESLLSAAIASEVTQVDNPPDSRSNVRLNVREDTVGYWRFEAEDEFGRDASPNGNILELVRDNTASTRSPLHAALVDLCHVLLNSNEFVYVD